MTETETTMMKVAAFQAPLLPFGSMDAIELIADRVTECVTRGVELLVCPEAIVGGLAFESNGDSLDDVALTLTELDDVVRPLHHPSLTTVLGFTERAPAGLLFNSAAILAGGSVVGVYRKVYPGYRTALSAGTELPVFDAGRTRIGIAICNDTWYVEPARVLAERGAAILCVPVFGAHPPDRYARLEPRGRNLLVARAVDTTTTLIAADVAGRRGDRVSAGLTAIVDPDGTVVASAEPYEPGLVVASVDRERRPFDPRGRDGWTNQAVTDAFVAIWRHDQDDP
ncbi:MAG TPA: carbon-nitrogen hydrolase family protein [Acidimicrobiales bacterium]